VVQATVALRVDVDTRRGLDQGVPRLLELFRRRDVRAAFFVTMGPDRSGRAIVRALRPSFLLKMWRTNPLALYGLRTLFSGTLAPARLVGAGAPALLRQIAAEGHEVAPHGWDHVGWQDHVHRLDGAAIRAELERAAGAFAAATGAPAHASAAPGWRTSPAALAAQDALGLDYASDTRGAAPFRPEVDGRVLATVQVPTTMPTMDEVLGRVRDVAHALAGAIRPGLNVFTLHAEVEGGARHATFATFLDELGRMGAGVVRLGDVAGCARAAGDELPSTPVVRGRVDGRSGWIAVAGTARPRRSRVTTG
jgi:peptidoglycan/xylan/chitin deacetylase (PgdA/CDA1 family)